VLTDGKKVTLVEVGGKRFYLSKKSSLQGLASEQKLNLLCIRIMLRRKILHPICEISPKVDLGRIYFCGTIIGKPVKCSDTLSGVSMAKDLVLLDSSRTKAVSYSAMWGYPWQMEKVLIKSFEPSRSHTITHITQTQDNFWGVLQEYVNGSVLLLAVKSCIHVIKLVFMSVM